MAPLVDAAEVFYVEGFFLTHGTDAVLELSTKASNQGKVFALNFSAPFIPQFFSAQLQSVLPYCDIIIANESEAEAYAITAGYPDPTDLAAIARSVAISPKANPSRQRVVIFTHGAESTVMVTSTEPDTPKVFKVTPIPSEQIVDTNGAGDAFAGGFLGAFVAGKSLDECVEVGHKMGAMCVKLVSRGFWMAEHSADCEFVRLVPNSHSPRSLFFERAGLPYIQSDPVFIYITLSTAKFVVSLHTDVLRHALSTSMYQLMFRIHCFGSDYGQVQILHKAPMFMREKQAGVVGTYNITMHRKDNQKYHE